MQLSAQFKLEKETKGTFRYAEETTGQPPKIGTLYVQKWALPRLPPIASPSLSKHWTDPRCLGIRTQSPRGTVKLSSLAAFSPPAATAKSLIISL